MFPSARGGPGNEGDSSRTTFPDLHVGARATKPGSSQHADRKQLDASSRRQHLRKRQRPRARGKQSKRDLSRAQASRRPTRCRFASARGAQEQITPHPQERIARCAGQSASTAPLHLSGGAALRWAAVRATDRTGFLCFDGLPGEQEKRAGTASGSRPVGSLKTRRACRRGPCGPPALRDALAICCSHPRRGQSTRVRHPR